MTKKMSAKEKSAFYDCVSQLIREAENYRRWRMINKEDENGETIRDENGEPVLIPPTEEYDRLRFEAWNAIIDCLNEL